MRNTTALLLGGLAVVCVAAMIPVAMLDETPPARCPNGKCPVKPPPASPKKPDTPVPQPSPKPKPWPHCGYQTVGLGSNGVSKGEISAVSVYVGGKESWVNGRESHGEVLTADFPPSFYMQNIGSHKDGAGMCVMTSITMCAKYLGLKDYYGLRDWCANEPGGAYRGKVDDQIHRYEKALGIANPVPYLQYEGPDPGPILEAIDKARLPFAHTYGWSPRYHSRIAHMVADCHYGTLAAVLDNNPMSDFDVPNAKMFEWMDRNEMIRRAKLGGGNMWVHCWLAPPPPPCPKVK